MESFEFLWTQRRAREVAVNKCITFIEKMPYTRVLDFCISYEILPWAPTAITRLYLSRKGQKNF